MNLLPSSLRARPLSAGALAFVCVLGAPAFAEPTVETELLVPANAVSITLAPTGTRAAAVVLRGSRQVVVVDGVAGPAFDRFHPNPASRPNLLTSHGQHTVVFSPDGSSFAYIGVQGDEWVVLRDHKELARGPMWPSAMPSGNSALRFSPKGKHLYWEADVGRPGFSDRRLFVNGQAGPTLNYLQTVNPVFSADEARWAYFDGRLGPSEPNRQPHVLVIDGKVAPYYGSDPQFTADGRSVVSRGFTPNGQALLVDGRPAVTASAIEKFFVAPAGRSLAAVVRQTSGGTSRTFLWLDGKEVPNSEGVVEVRFSPDGKRWAAAGRGPSGGLIGWVMIDGKRSPNYQNITWDAPAFGPNTSPTTRLFSAQFTSDSKKFVYVAMQAQRSFVVVEDAESDAYAYVNTFLTPDNRVAFMASTGQIGPRDLVVIGDSALRIPQRRGASLVEFSPDGSRHAILAEEQLYLDGRPLEGLQVRSWTGNENPLETVRFSPNGRHLVYAATRAGSRERHLYLDGRPIMDLTTTSAANITFTPDSRHLFWSHRERRPAGPGTDTVISVDGVPAYRWDNNAPLVGLLTHPNLTGVWEMGRDGKLRVLHGAAEGIVRATLTPSPKRDLAALLAAASTTAAAAAPTAPAATAAAAPAAAPATAARAAVARPAVAAPAAPVQPLTWRDLVRRPEAWPAQATLKKALRFGDGTTVRENSAIGVVEIKANALVAMAPGGAFVFEVGPDDTDALAVANAAWAALTPEQRDLTYAALLRRTELWPYRVKIKAALEITGAPRLPAGSEVLFLRTERNQLLLQLTDRPTTFNLAPQETDLLEQARSFLASEVGAPGRLVEELAGKLVDPTSNRATALPADSRPRYVVLYRAAGWCGVCAQFTPQFVEALRTKPADVEVIYISSDRSVADMQDYAQKQGFAWPALRYENTGQLPAFSGLFGRSIPQVVVTDRHGNIVLDSQRTGAERALAQLREML
jgi:Tol biopolymer transport system component/thiol-disulfide isomerase/thioredoxin